MKSAALDTSVVMRLLTGAPEAQAKVAFHAFSARLASGGAVSISDLVVSEAYFALQHHYKVPKAEALKLLRSFVFDSGVQSTGSAGKVLQTPRLATAKPGFIDRLIHAEGVDVAEEFLTFETAAAKLKNARVLKG